MLLRAGADEPQGSSALAFFVALFWAGRATWVCSTSCSAVARRRPVTSWATRRCGAKGRRRSGPEPRKTAPPSTRTWRKNSGTRLRRRAQSSNRARRRPRRRPTPNLPFIGPMLGLVVIALFLLALAAAARLWLPRFLAAFQAQTANQLAERNAEVDRRLESVVETMDRRLAELDTKVDRRLESASQTSIKIHERLGKVDEATTQMLQRAQDLPRLEQALRPPKARGGFGELLLENLLRDRLPPSAYQMQYTFDSGERVDAVVTVDRVIPIDSKFPLDNYNRLVEAESDEER